MDRIVQRCDRQIEETGEKTKRDMLETEAQDRAGERGMECTWRWTGTDTLERVASSRVGKFSVPHRPLECCLLGTCCSEE